jgi:hypothetical protein
MKIPPFSVPVVQVHTARETMKIGTAGKPVSLIPTFYQSIFADLHKMDSLYAQYQLDRDEVLQRISCEGDKFATQTLPLLGKAVETSLITLTKLVTPLGFKLKSNCCYPLLMSYFFEQLFDREGMPTFTESASEAELASRSLAVKTLRQVLLAFSKFRDSDCMQSDKEASHLFVERIGKQPNISLTSQAISYMRKLIRNIVMDGSDLHPSLAQWEENPYGRQGPGAVAAKESGASKWSFDFIPGTDPLLYRYNNNSQPFGKSQAKPFNRFCLVPKDFRKKRVICIEPKEFQFAQQGLMEILYELIERDPLTRKSIDFRSQLPNQRLSKDRRYATIDLKDASDLLSLKLCRLLFPKDFFALVTRYRSRRCLVNETSYEMTCFASMGSALCFPIETLVFWACARCACDLGNIPGHIRVFGDDIIIPVEAYELVTALLSSAGFVVNTEKSCYKTPVRESCGSWWFGNTDCRFSKIYASRCDDAEAWMGLVETAKSLALDLFTETSRSILEFLTMNSEWIPPFGCFGLPESLNGTRPLIRWNKELQRSEIQMPILSSGEGSAPLPQDYALYAWLVGNETEPSRYGTVLVKNGWVLKE